MTKATGIGRGGPRAGAGRPKLEFPPAPPTTTGKVAKPRYSSARQLVSKAYATLAQVMESSPSPAARVNAARLVIELAKAEEIDDPPMYRPPFREHDGEAWDELLGRKQ